MSAFGEFVEKNRIACLEDEVKHYRAALMRIAALTEGPVVHGGFDEPGAATMAREALAAEWIGPCVHERDPWDRCSKCCRAGLVVAWVMAEIAKEER